MALQVDEEKQDKLNNIQGGEGESPMREVTIDLEIDRQNLNADKESVASRNNLAEVHGVTTMEDSIYT